MQGDVSSQGWVVREEAGRPSGAAQRRHRVPGTDVGHKRQDLKAADGGGQGKDTQAHPDEAGLGCRRRQAQWRGGAAEHEQVGRRSPQNRMQGGGGAGTIEGLSPPAPALPLQGPGTVKPQRAQRRHQQAGGGGDGRGGDSGRRWPRGGDSGGGGGGALEGCGGRRLPHQPHRGGTSGRDSCSGGDAIRLQLPLGLVRGGVGSGGGGAGRGVVIPGQPVQVGIGPTQSALLQEAVGVVWGGGGGGGGLQQLLKLKPEVGKVEEMEVDAGEARARRLHVWRRGQDSGDEAVVGGRGALPTPHSRGERAPGQQIETVTRSIREAPVGQEKV
ncbi:hypothetical protein PLESTB_000280400 [Pleodorina starrii]|uniref:Uncharacterized protein n=1 Tax=Pleodorina starrii TaxID=330485 RepID=A0A9W6BCT8_9CHLO|nr:hypothetical protein PLESTM_001408900 [Pleodorina starrii]GLC49729.1 hypothetical protein PLESTB_000280400 [Pleodorina starrii]GLC76030.1 hypothetical protein PLESTF_001722300 [Pleodorina starrii]